MGPSPKNLQLICNLTAAEQGLGKSLNHELEQWNLLENLRHNKF